MVVLNTGDPVTMTKWIGTTPALLDMWYGGEEGGHGLASILFGDANPSGKLPVTLPKRYEDNPAAANYPGKNLEVNYAEGIYVGYRYYDTKNVEPQFPFGFGLSYTKFEYSDLKLESGMKSNASGNQLCLGSNFTGVNVRNSKARVPAAEVVQVYVHDGHAKIDRLSAHELKGFQRVELQPGETKTVEFTLERAAFSYWDPAMKTWRADPGTFEIQVGSSSRDIRLRAPLQISISRSKPSTQLARRLVRLNAQHVRENAALLRAERALVARGVEHCLPLIGWNVAQIAERAFRIMVWRSTGSVVQNDAQSPAPTCAPAATTARLMFSARARRRSRCASGI